MTERQIPLPIAIPLLLGILIGGIVFTAWAVRSDTDPPSPAYEAEKGSKTGNTLTQEQFEQHANPTMGDLHELLVPFGYLVDMHGDNMAWKKGDEAIYFEVEGSGNGQIAREITVLTMFTRAKKVWSSHKVKVEKDEIHILNEAREWEKVFDRSGHFHQTPQVTDDVSAASSPRIDEDSPVDRDAEIAAFQQRVADHLKRLEQEGETTEWKAEAAALLKERDELLRRHYPREPGGYVARQSDLESQRKPTTLETPRPTGSLRSDVAKPNYRSIRDIDRFVDEQVEKHWLPMPGGNSKEDAKRVTKDVLKARNWAELERVLEKHAREGR